jgi:acetoin utilization protein AcuB
MLVKYWMHENVVTVEPKDSMQQAIKLLKKHNIRRLPVVENGKVVGIVTDRDLKRASASDATTLEIHELFYLISTINVEDIMTRVPITVPMDYTIEETAEILLNNKISGVPVVDHEGRLRGIITQTELFRTLITLTGLSKRGIQFAFQMEDRPGSIKETADIIRKYGGRVISILSHCGRVPTGFRKVYIRAYEIERSELEQLKEELKRSADLLYLVDHRENKREIYLPEDSHLSYREVA